MKDAKTKDKKTNPFQKTKIEPKEQLKDKKKNIKINCHWCQRRWHSIRIGVGVKVGVSNGSGSGKKEYWLVIWQEFDLEMQLQHRLQQRPVTPKNEKQKKKNNNLTEPNLN